MWRVSRGKEKAASVKWAAGVCLIWGWQLVLHCLRSQCEFQLWSCTLRSSSAVCTKEIVIICILEFHMHFYSFVSVFHFSSPICFMRTNPLPWARGGKKSQHKIIWCVYIWASKYNSYHAHLSWAHLSFILCTVVTITTSRRKAAFLTPKCPWVFHGSLSSYKWNTFNSMGWRFLQCNFSLQVKLVITTSW